MDKLLREIREKCYIGHNAFCDMWDKRPCTCSFQDILNRIDAALSPTAGAPINAAPDDMMNLPSFARPVVAAPQVKHDKD